MADWGAQTWDDAGRETMGPNIRAGLFKGSFTVAGGQATGFFQDASIAGRSIFYLVQVNGGADFYDRPSITFNASTALWDWQGPVALGFTVFYGAR